MDNNNVNDYKDCPYCDEEIKAIAIKCRYCKSILINDDNDSSDLKTIEQKSVVFDTNEETQPKKQPPIGSSAKKNNKTVIIIAVICFLIFAGIYMAETDESTEGDDLAKDVNEQAQVEEKKSTISDSQAEFNARTFARKIILENLYSPSTAKFRTTEVIDVDPYDRHLVRFELDAQNRFGGTGRYIAYVIVQIRRDLGTMHASPLLSHVVIERGESEVMPLLNLKSFNNWNEPIEKESTAVSEVQKNVNEGTSSVPSVDDSVIIVVVDVPEYENLNLRSGPGTNYSILGKLRRGTELTSLSEVTGSDGDQWLQVRTPDGKVGWVHKDYIR